MTKRINRVTFYIMERIVEQFREFLASPQGAIYIARRVRVGAKAEMKEVLRLEAWLRDHAIFSPHTERM